MRHAKQGPQIAISFRTAEGQKPGQSQLKFKEELGRASAPSPNEPGKPQRDFIGSGDPPVIAASVPGKIFLVKTDRNGSINVGSPVFLRDMQLGEVLGWDFGDLAEKVTIRVFVVGPMLGSTDLAAQMLLKRGLRASLQSARFITGQQNVVLSFDQDAPPAVS